MSYAVRYAQRAENDIRQIHIPFGKSGYSALYTVQDVIEIVGILRVKHQRESRY